MPSARLPLDSGLRGLGAALLFTVTLGAGCGGHGTAEQVARACEHQLAMSMRGALAARRAREAPPGTARARQDVVDAASLDAEVQAALAAPAGQQSLARCRSLYVELPVSRLECILAAGDPVAINACMPQADRQHP